MVPVNRKMGGLLLMQVCTLVYVLMGLRPWFWVKCTLVHVVGILHVVVVVVHVVVVMLIMLVQL